jgi:Zn-dependent protease
MDPHLQRALLFVPGFLIGLTFHESAHAITAKWLGDPTAERMGRVSLNPLRHLSPMGTLLLFFVGFGWGKPVPINIRNFKKPRLYYLLSSLAGPAVNVLLAAVALGILYLRPHHIVAWVCISVFFVNTLLAVFNMLPIPPLDGSKIWQFIIPGFEKVTTGQWSGIWMIVLFIGLYTGLIGEIIDPVFEFMYSLLPSA